MKNLIFILFLWTTFVYNGYCGKWYFITDVKYPVRISLFNDKAAVSHSGSPFEDSSFSVYDGTKWIHYEPENVLDLIDDTMYIKNIGRLKFHNFQFDSKGNIWGFLGNDAIGKFDWEKITPYYTFLNWEKTDTIKLWKIRSNFIVDNWDNPWIIGKGYYPVVDYVMKFEDGIFKAVHKYKFPSVPLEGGTTGFSKDSKNHIWYFYHDTLLVFYPWGGLYRKLGLKSLFAEDTWFVSMGISKTNIKYFIDPFFYLYVHNDSIWYRDSYANSIERWKLGDTIEFTSSTIRTCVDSSGNVWFSYWGPVSFPTYLYKRTPEGKWSIYEIPRTPDSGHCAVTDVQADYRGRIWIVCLDRLIMIFDPNYVDGVDEGMTEGLPDVWVRKLYPNPATEFARLEFFLEPDVNEQFTAGLYNSYGVKVMDLKPYFSYEPRSASGVLQFPVRGIPPGLYLVTLSAGNSRYTKKLIIVE